MKKHVFLISMMLAGYAIYGQNETVNGNLQVNGLLNGGFGAYTSGGVLDWNHISNAKSGSGYSILNTSALNAPGGLTGASYHPFNFEYWKKDGTGNITQLAIPYGHSTSISSGIWMRGRYDGSWTSWVRVLSENLSGRVGIGTTNPLALVHIKGNSPVMMLENAQYAHTDNQFYSYLSGRDKNRHETWWLGEGSSGGKLTGFYTNAPGYTMNLFNNSSGITIADGGNVGIGTTSPSEKLEVDGNIKSTSISTSADSKFNGLTIGNYGTPLFGLTNPYHIFSPETSGERDLLIFGNGGGSNGNATLHLRLYDGDLKLGSSTEPNAMIYNNGNSYFKGKVAIGITTPAYALDVSGTIRLSGGDLRTGDTKFTFWSGTTGSWAPVESMGLNIGDWNTNPIYGQIVTGDYDFNLNVKDQIRFFVESDNGNVGIGTNNPGKKLEVNGDILLNNDSGIKQIFTWNASDNNWRIGTNENPGFTRALANRHVQYLTYSTSAGQGFAIGVNGGNSSFEILGSNHMAYFRGNVGLGTTSTGSHKLAVEGSIGAREIKVEASGWSDFVFYDDYQLPTLEQVEQHIKEKGHLKDIPSAAEVEKNGIFLGEMDAKLLQKIEELTLYTIQQEKELKKVKAQEAKIQKQEKRIQKLEQENKQLKSLLERITKLEEKLKKN